VKPARLDIEFFVRFEMVSERPEELVSYDAALVVREAALPCLVYLEVVAPPDSELALLRDLPVERPKAVVLTELADCLRIRYGAPVDVVAACSVAMSGFRGKPRTPSGGDKIGSAALCNRAGDAVTCLLGRLFRRRRLVRVRRLTSSRRALALSTRSDLHRPVGRYLDDSGY